MQQAGIFGVSGFDQTKRVRGLAKGCPNVLLPYARTAVANMIQDGGFPPFLLQPINFEALYDEQMRRRAEGAQPNA